MTTEVKVPDIGDFSDVPVISVLVSVGDTIEKEDPLIELESDKATMEVPSSHAGTVKEIKVGEGDSVTEGDVILVIEESGSDDASGGDKAAEDAPKEEKPKTEEAPKAQSGGGASSGGGSEQQSSSGPRPGGAAGAVTDQGFGKVHASPSVRAFARRVDIDLSTVNGTGRKGRILREDVEKALKSAAPAAAAGGGAAAQGGMGIPPIPPVDFSKFGPTEDVEMSRIKKISGPALHRSWLNIPHVTHNEDADITDLDKYRKELDTQAKEEGYRVTLLSFIVKASVSALKKHWEFNSSIHPDGDKLIKKDFFNIGFAADTPNGLMVPVIKDADRKGIVDISKDLMNLSAAAREGKLKGDDMKGATFTISSLGGIGGTSFTPIVNAPEVAILGLTRSKMAPVWDGEQFVPRNMLPMSLSYDHRAIDGALAARFCAHLKYLLADPRRLML
ncbi:dihydrolipoyllysine-residue acetyltransferase component of pyruvate dehydrogenase complex [Roseivivax marinus]|uniref:Acetyltransferase component of pyruvate dehydrogenase complex n=1 Tax=Roseivivax marinus TaxID=1379903 RepID=W4HEX6_9RHOB|nr:dihydrolipoyllysine-residue acetyltransferase [Roseivivax marinus]ETW10933.1 dihydrolipoyllysine-residue acetyltransferase component of pyruvate dehydrogenase complex [Roseivivax marinus]UMA64957.1 dihydrolipoyllysine-residue acetyltransferase [Roseivivax marinus]SEL90476.1 pyruvate dehydrogenase E2 component (dihydrolipoamide acetyltransferase) [Roseivivax marinus]